MEADKSDGVQVSEPSKVGQATTMLVDDDMPISPKKIIQNNKAAIMERLQILRF